MNKKLENKSISANSLALNNTGLPPIKKVQLTISILNKGFVKFGTFLTKDLQFRGDFRIGKKDTLVATPAEGFQFDQWRIKLKNPDRFVFVTDAETTSITPFEDMEIQAVFTQEDS